MFGGHRCIVDEFHGSVMAVLVSQNYWGSGAQNLSAKSIPTNLVAQSITLSNNRQVSVRPVVSPNAPPNEFNECVKSFVP